MRRIVSRLTIVDDQGTPWDCEVTIPWIDRPTDPVKYGPDAGHGDDEPMIIINTPDDPDHWGYGEDGPKFNLDQIRALVAAAEYHDPRGLHCVGCGASVIRTPQDAQRHAILKDGSRACSVTS